MFEMLVTSTPNLRMFLIEPSPQSKRAMSSFSDISIQEKPLSTLGTAAEVPKKMREVKSDWIV